MRAFAGLILATLVTLLSACASTGSIAPHGPINAEVTLAPGELTEIAGASIRVRFVGVTNDSRCPADAVCIQGGDAIVRIEVLPVLGGQATYDLHTGNLQPVRHDDLTIALVQ